MGRLWAGALTPRQARAFPSAPTDGRTLRDNHQHTGGRADALKSRSLETARNQHYDRKQIQFKISQVDVFCAYFSGIYRFHGLAAVCTGESEQQEGAYAGGRGGPRVQS